MSDKSLRVLHFADAHIDIANYGRRDPESGLPVRVMDFLHSLDQIVNAAVAQKVDLVLFAGDAYKDRNPQPTFQREWGKRMMRLSKAGIPTLLLIGNHDVSPATGRAHTLQEFRTLSVPHIHVADTIKLWRPEELGVAAQIVTVPWVSRSRLMSREETSGKDLEEIMLMIEERVLRAIRDGLDKADPDLPLILAAHASVQGAKYGSERAVMLGRELVLSGQIIGDKRLDYVALGHIHKHQSLTPEGGHPPVVYPGSIERIDFGEAAEEKGYVLAEIGDGQTAWQFVPLETRRYIDLAPDTPERETFMADILNQLPDAEKVRDAVCRVRLTYPADWETLLDEKALADYFSEAFSLQVQKHRVSDRRARLGDTLAVDSLSPLELLEKYWQSTGMSPAEVEEMGKLAQSVLFMQKD